MKEDYEEQSEIIAALTEEVKEKRQQLMSKNIFNANENDSQDIIVALTDEVKKLRNEQLSGPNNNDSADIISALTDQVKMLYGELEEKQRYSDPREIEATVRAEVQEEIASMRMQKEFFGNEVAKLQTKLDSLENDCEKNNALEKQLSAVEEGRTQFEKTMISTYERKLSLIQMNKDLTIDSLRKDLTQTKGRQKNAESEFTNKIKSLEGEREELEVELQAKMQHKNSEIQYLTNALAAHEQVSGNMKQELDQLQYGMESVSVTRRAEVEEMQDDPMDAQSKATKNEREITALKMKNEEYKLRHKNDISRLKDQILTLESDNITPMMRDIQFQRDDKRILEVTDQMENLKRKVSSLQDENLKLRDKA